MLNTPIVWRAQRGPSYVAWSLWGLPPLSLKKKCIAERPRRKTPNYMNPQALALSVYSLTSVQSCFSPAPFLSRLLIAGEHLPLQTLSKQLHWKNSTCRQIPTLHQTFSQVLGNQQRICRQKALPLWRSCFRGVPGNAERVAPPLIFLPLRQVWWLLQKQEEGCPVMTKWQSRGKA